MEKTAHGVECPARASAGEEQASAFRLDDEFLGAERVEWHIREHAPRRLTGADENGVGGRFGVGADEEGRAGDLMERRGQFVCCASFGRGGGWINDDDAPWFAVL